MSLQVWLPLTKDTRNQGLANVTVTNSGATYQANAGKLGGAYYFNGSSRIQISLPTSMTTIKNTTVAAWVKSTSATLALGGISHNSTPEYYMPECTLYTSGWQTGTGSGWAYISGGTVANTNVWHHVACTISNTDVTTYLDGVQVATKTLSAWGMTTFDLGSGHFIEIGSDFPGGDEYLTGYINDFRVYDNCLSSKEVKEISNGLILHYPLNRKGFGSDNLFLNTHFDARYSQTSGWDTSKNGTTLASSWGGYNSGVTNASTVYHAHLKQVDNVWVYEYIKTSNENWLGISQGGLQSKLVAGETYTFSCEQYCVEGINYIATGLYYYKPNASSANFHLGLKYLNTDRQLGKWQKFSYTFVAPSDGDYSKNMSWYIYGHYGGNGTLYLRYPKLEKSSIATPWCPNLSDTIYSTLGLNNGVEYDCSGGNNNGTRTGTFDWTNDTPKYKVGTKFDTTSYLNTNFKENFGTDNFTFAAWVKMPLESGLTYQPIFTCKGVGAASVGVGLYYNHNQSKFLWSTANGSSAVEIWTVNTVSNFYDNWTHVVMVRDSNDSKKGCIYINGVRQELVSVPTIVDITNTDTPIMIGGMPSAYATYKFTGKMSDFRIYATALSAEDVLALYENKL